MPKHPQRHADGWKSRRVRNPTPLVLKRLLNERGIRQVRLSEAITLADGTHPSEATITQMVIRDIWPVRTPKEWLQQQISDWLREQGYEEEEIQQAFQIDEAPDQLRAKPPSTPRKPVQSHAPVAEEMQLPETEMLSEAAKKHFKIYTDPFLGDVQGPGDVFLRSRPSISSRYCAAMSFVFKARRRAHSRAYVTVAATPKTEDRASKIGKLYLDDSLVPSSAISARPCTRRPNTVASWP